ncbi:hypothetical protein, variant 1 [Aphanomyces invadans]|uniref:THO complex subunit 5 n=1 Tax=Aphanomyces invadans TaxID=157072 RepID=A0A024TS33_9STRA|nr:hypothetical protein, variant 1 [Aphanomyces invadans]ETV96833.1 hypothetical protein, variant 1 [Aphanomyces invadans]|eukprot:XP_008874609.1 hypothetical protein, variant 1 [Aphanomyces invadans]
MPSTLSPLEQLNAACRGFRETLPRLIQSMDDNATSTSNDVVRALCLLKDIKQSTRETFLDAEGYRRRVAEQKDLVEAHHLKLQNLLYEKDHLLREIRRCKGYPTKELDQIQFKDGPLPVLVDADSHDKHLKRLDDELADRKAQLQHQQDLKAQIAAVDEAVQAKHALLDTVPAHIAAIEEATRPLQALLSIPISESTQRHRDAKVLPAPLYSLFCELDAFLSIHPGTGTVAIGEAKVGSLSKLRIKSRKSTSAAAPEKIEADDTAAPPDAKRAKLTDPHDAAPFVPAPQSLVLELYLPTAAGAASASDSHKTKVLFMYLPQLRVVVVEAPRYPALLRNLFAADSGTDFPNQPAIAYAFEASDGMEVPMAFPTDVKARPYVWAQWITGLSSTGRIEPSIRHVMARLRHRYTIQHALYGHLDALKEKRVDLSPSSELASASVKTKLHSWSKVARDDISVFPDYVDGTLYFRASLVPPGDVGRVVAFVEISPEYPKVAPRFVVQKDVALAALPTADQLKSWLGATVWLVPVVVGLSMSIQSLYLP